MDCLTTEETQDKTWACSTKTTDYSLLCSSVAKLYLSCQPADELLKYLVEVPNLCLSEEFQKQILRCTEWNEKAIKYPPAISYRRNFLKRFLKLIEDSQNEVCEELYCAYTKLLSITDDEGFSYVTYILNSSCCITLKETRNIVAEGTTGLRSWQASKCLAEWCLENKSVFTERKVLELGSGIGLTGIAVCLLCKPSTYIFTDCHSMVLKTLNENISLNLPTGCVEDSKNSLHDVENRTERASYHLDESTVCAQIKCLDWETAEKSDCEILASDFILGADIVYDPSLIGPLTRVLLWLLKPNTEALIACTIRNGDTWQLFLESLERSSLTWTSLELPNIHLFLYDKSCEIKILKIKGNFG